MIGLLRQIPRADTGMHGGKWERGQLLGRELKGKVLGIVGLGRIGGEVAHRAHAFGMTVVSYDPYVSDERFAALRVKRGSTTISFALRCCIASTTHLNPQGWASAALPPMTRTRSVFLISVQEFVIAPRPKVGPRLDTVGACQMRACVSRVTSPRPRAILTLR